MAANVEVFYGKAKKLHLRFIIHYKKCAPSHNSIKSVYLSIELFITKKSNNKVLWKNWQLVPA